MQPGSPFLSEHLTLSSNIEQTADYITENRGTGPLGQQWQSTQAAGGSVVGHRGRAWGPGTYLLMGEIHTNSGQRTKHNCEMLTNYDKSFE